MTGQHARVAIPIGDDLGAIRSDELMLVGIDQLLDGVHFDSKIHSPFDIGKKAVNRNLSDCAAMACLPSAMVMSIALPDSIQSDFLERLLAGVHDAGKRFDCPLIGGDTAVWRGPLAISVAILGRAEGIEPITRCGAKPGDRIYVTGALGGSILGRHLTFDPKVHLARELASSFRIHAMMDISDGLSRDLPKLCEPSIVGAKVDSTLIPIHPDAQSMNDNRSPLEHALHDGEDHELLVISPGCSHPSLTDIGEISAEGGVYLRDGDNVKPLEPRGWEYVAGGGR